jgi:hypothetical protein
MRKLALCAIAFGLGVVAGGCGGSSAADDVVDASAVIDADVTPDATPTVTIDDICAPDGLYAKLVAKLIACNPFLDLLVLQGQGTPAAVSALCHGAVDPYRPATIDLPSYAELQACRAYVDGTACSDLDFNGSPCNVLHGKLADTSGCDSTEQCKDTSFCDRPNPDACGTCKARLADSSTCTADEQCTGGKCVGTQCGHPGKDGDPCILDAQGNSDDCLGQRVCNKQTHLCETRTWQLNQACTALGECGILQTDLYCKLPTGGGPGQCAHYLAVGDPCGGNLGMCDLRSYQFCNQVASTPRCTDPGIVQEGAACSMFQGKKCAAGLVCSDPINGGKCYTPGPKGATCGTQGAAPCAAFLNCIGGTCQYTDNTPACP